MQAGHYITTLVITNDCKRLFTNYVAAMNNHCLNKKDDKQVCLTQKWQEGQGVNRKDYEWWNLLYYVSLRSYHMLYASGKLEADLNISHE